MSSKRSGHMSMSSSNYVGWDWIYEHVISRKHVIGQGFPDQLCEAFLSLFTTSWSRVSLSFKLNNQRSPVSFNQNFLC